MFVIFSRHVCLGQEMLCAGKPSHSSNDTVPLQIQSSDELRLKKQPNKAYDLKKIILVATC
jgi:hypothetical protein